MPREIYVPLGDSGNANLYFRRRNAAGQYLRGDTKVYEDFNPTNLALYGADAGSGTPYNVLGEDGSTGDYFGDDPTSGTGTWTAYEQAGAAPAQTDDAVATGDFPQAAAAAAIAATPVTLANGPHGGAAATLTLLSTSLGAVDALAVALASDFIVGGSITCSTDFIVGRYFQVHNTVHWMAGLQANGIDAYFLAAADIGSQAVARTGTGSHDLSTLSDQFAGIATEDKQDEILADIAAIVPAGGIYTQTVTVKTTGGAAIPNATVAIYSGSVLIDIKTTNSSGIAQPMCDAGSYTLRVAATGYSSSSTSLTVTGDATLADIVLSSSETTITPSADQAKTTAYWIVYGADTMPVGEDDVTATIWIIKMPSDHGAAYVDNPVQTISTTTNGILSATLFKGATYQIALSDGREWVVEVPLKAGTTYKMPPIRVAEA
jgi:hypothetical protein